MNRDPIKQHKQHNPSQKLIVLHGISTKDDNNRSTGAVGWFSLDGVWQPVKTYSRYNDAERALRKHGYVAVEGVSTTQWVLKDRDVVTLRFEDHGQDFLEWDVDRAGVVVASRPFQADVWCGKVLEKTGSDYAAGDKVSYAHEGGLRTISYPIAEVRP
jgi:hypothetical protein